MFFLHDFLYNINLQEKRCRALQKKQLPKSWSFKEKDGTLLGQKVTPLERVGIYVPGGKAVYPSTVLMNAIPAKVAGVDKIYKVGGAQAVAAMAYGTESIPKVDKIVGPGNIYVATAKRLVF